MSLGYIFVTYILKFIAIPLTEGNLTSFYKVEPIKTFHEFSDNETHNNFTETEKLDTIRKYILSNQRSKDFWESGFSKKD